MEVLGNGSPIKDGENQASGGNYSCRLPRDLNIGNSTSIRNKGETDVRLLLACKAQLSSEVVRLKTDSLRLQKERDAARIRMKELDQMVGKFLDRTRELENRLSVAEDENKKLRGKMLDSSNVCALKKLSVSLDKFHSYPWSDSQTNPSATPSSCLNTLETKKNPPPQEDWKEVSQKLLEQMKQEMKELKQLSNNFSLQESDISNNDEVVHEIPDSKICDDEVEESLLSLKLETESLKHCLLHQRKTLKSLMIDVMQGSDHPHAKELAKDESKGLKALQTSVDQSVKPKSSISQYARLSDDSFRAFFTKHLDSCHSDKISKTPQHFVHSDSQNAADSSKSVSKVSSPKSTKPKTETDKQNLDKRVTEEERVCPICQESFHESVPQSEFEKHVLDHLEEESASLLDQYVVL